MKKAKILLFLVCLLGICLGKVDTVQAVTQEEFDQALIAWDHIGDYALQSGVMMDGSEIGKHVTVCLNGKQLVYGVDYEADMLETGWFMDYEPTKPCMYVEVEVFGLGTYEGLAKVYKMGTRKKGISITYNVEESMQSNAKNPKKKKIGFELDKTVIGYDIYRRTDGGNWDLIDADVIEDEWEDNTATSGHAYEYKVHPYTYEVITSPSQQPKKTYGNMIDMGSCYYVYNKITKKKLNNGNVTITFKRDKKADGYQVGYTFHRMQPNHTENIKGNKKKTYTIKKWDKSVLPLGYKIWIRNYKKVKGKKIYSPWSNYITVKTK